MPPNSDAAATKADINALRSDVDGLKSDVHGLKSDVHGLKSDIGGLKGEMRELIERVETSLLSEFRTWAQTYEVRARGTSTAVRDFDERLGNLEERMSRLERNREQRH